MFSETKSFGTMVFGLLFGFGLLFPGVVFAHCDTLAGPVIIEAQKALETGNVTSVLKWVKEDREESIKTAFKEALQQRKADKGKADSAFFEILVRIHREGEGAPFTGVKPADAVLPPAIVAADKALDSGSSQALIELLSKDLIKGINTRYTHALEKKQTSEKSVAAGREYVAAYVEYVHYVEAISEILDQKAGQHHESASKDPQGGCSSCDHTKK